MISIEKYAELCAYMADTGGDVQREVAIAEANGVSGAEWMESKTAWTARMSDPADGGRTALQFMPIYQEAQARARGGAEPCSMEFFAKVHAEMSYRRDPMGNKIDYNIVLAENGVPHHKWLECEGYWTPIVGADTILGQPNPKFDPARSQQYQAMLEQERIRVMGGPGAPPPGYGASPNPSAPPQMQQQPSGPMGGLPGMPVGGAIGKVGKFFRRG